MNPFQPSPTEPRRAPDNAWHRPLPYAGPERRTASLALAILLAQVLDEIDYGVLLLADARQVLHVNHAARGELGQTHPLQLLGGELRARHSKDVAALHDAVHDAVTRGLRRLLTLGDGAQRINVSVIPLGWPGWSAVGRGDTSVGALLMLGRREVCGELSIHGYARAHGLSEGEERVLRALCDGLTPNEIAERHQVKIATVRTQIACIRAKTDTPGIRELVQAVAVLPPMMGVLRGFLGGSEVPQIVPRRVA
ncbi:helix-turn-helix transcriptional regulator [Ideonella sp. 4Y11]|uniref:Helix-turn-helix transcriptional regulator n=1 Tax=Ideonella aquatica TaxID=2824119 RepID=A0A940YHN1_9BURK|nr:helix-turn-helix transcriptional regulator [Ideonella aquatica]MBQ0960290.1 helix-turn-helix transcriptional regulator [Ideonella aquatica]